MANYAIHLIQKAWWLFVQVMPIVEPVEKVPALSFY